MFGQLHTGSRIATPRKLAVGYASRSRTAGCGPRLPATCGTSPVARGTLEAVDRAENGPHHLLRDIRRIGELRRASDTNSYTKGE